MTERVELRLVGLLKKYGPEQASIQIEPGQTVSDAILSLGVNPDLVAIVMVNGRQRSKADLLEPGDKVKLLPMVGGG
ncbi:MAG TPA: MoaD/ThiS family protein [Anaerolineae bacterium]|nr:MoaD/ThiS family protein [Anaerolineae bacterium]